MSLEHYLACTNALRRHVLACIDCRTAMATNGSYCETGDACIEETCISYNRLADHYKAQVPNILNPQTKVLV